MIFRATHTPIPVRHPITGMLDHFERGPTTIEASDDDGASWRPLERDEIARYFSECTADGDAFRCAVLHPRA